MNYKYITDFHKSREAKIGASDIPHLIPHPEIQIESLAAYTDNKGKRHHCTALDLYNEKVDGKEWEYSFPADMGHYLEGKALFEFIQDNINYETAFDFLRGYQLHKLETELQSKGCHPACVNPEPYNTTPFKHNTEATNDFGVAHADCVYVPIFPASEIPTVKKNGLIIDLSKPFGIQAKSANFFAVNARKKDKYKGYDVDLKTWQGIPLGVYFQVQYEMILYGYDTTFLTLIYNTNSKHYWQIKANKKHQADLIRLATYMKKCIDTRTPPKQLVMNSKDIQKLYPVIQDDFREIQSDELSEVMEIVKIRHEAATQESQWKRKKEDAQERLSLHLKDTDMIKGVVNGSLQTIAKWKKTGGGYYIEGLKEIGKRGDSRKIMNYLERNGLVREKNAGRNPSVVIKKSELEE